MSFPFPTEATTEGLADLIVPKLLLYARGRSEYVPHLAPVFYNPRMQLSRDIAILALRAFQRSSKRPLRVADPLTGCGVRGIRFALEVEGLDQVEVNDLSPFAVELTRANIDRNHVGGKVKVSNLDCNLFLAKNASPKKRFDVLDLDPFGSPSRFLDSAVRAVANHGLLEVTATDGPPLCGVEPDACQRKYMGRPIRSEYCHEVAIRLIISSIVLTAARHNLGSRVLLSYSVDHYFRACVRLDRGARCADAAVRNLGHILHCFQCLNRTWVIGLTQEMDLRCPRCGSRMHVAGPLWLGPLVDSEFCMKAKAEAAESKVPLERANKVLRLLAEEAKIGPTYYVIDRVCDRLGLPIPPREAVVNELRDRGFTAARTHFAATALKTDASISEVEAAIESVARR